jgi:hypothetical protein
VLLNSAGPYEDPDKPGASGTDSQQDHWLDSAKDEVINAIKRVVLFFAFQRARQPERIKEVLSMVYVNPKKCDDDLVDSIVMPAMDPQVRKEAGKG